MEPTEKGLREPQRTQMNNVLSTIDKQKKENIQETSRRLGNPKKNFEIVHG